MVEETIDEKVREGLIRKLGRGVRRAVLPIVVGAVIGGFLENYTRFFYKTTTKSQIMLEVYDGATWKKGADSEFYRYNTQLYVDPDTKEMMGVDLRDDGTIVGYRREDGTVGLRWYEEVGVDAKTKFKEFQTWLDETYDYIEDGKPLDAAEEYWEQARDYINEKILPKLDE